MADSGINSESGNGPQEQVLKERIGRVVSIADEVSEARLGRFNRTELGTFVYAHWPDIFVVLRSLGLGPNQRFTDLGSGDGRWVFVASILGLDAQGYEIRQDVAVVAEEIKQRLQTEGLLSPDELARAKLHRGDLFEADISGSDALLYWEAFGAGSKKVENKILRQAKPGAKIVIYGYLGGFQRLKPAGSSLRTSVPTRVFVK